MNTKKTKLEKLVTFLKSAATNKSVVNRATITRQFGTDPAYVVYFNGLRRNGGLKKNGTVNVSRLSSALTGFRKENLARQVKHYASRNGSLSVSR